MTLAGVVGFPVRHSRSPAMMNAAFRELRLDWLYLPLPMPPELLAEAAQALPGSGYAGANVTIPYKVAAYELADERTPAAAAIGATNTLTFADGRIEADNTDAQGLLDAIGEPLAGRRALVLGAGGAARAAVWALREAGTGEVALWNRTPERAAELAAALGARAVERPHEADVMVNATSVGLEPVVGEAEALESLRLDRVDPPGLFVDLVYGDRPTVLCSWAARGGGRVVAGLEVLVRQGALSLERWTGRSAPIEAMREAVSASASA